MLGPTLAFAWWLVSLPPGKGPASAGTSAREEPTPNLDGSDLGTAKLALVRSVLTPEMVHTAQTFLDLPMGTERTAILEGRTYLFVLERHYHPPGFVGAPTGWHKGVTIYEESPAAL